MLENIKRFLFGTPPHPDLNTVHYQHTEPPARGGLFLANQRAEGDIWYDTTTTLYTAHRWNGKYWERLEGE